MSETKKRNVHLPEFKAKVGLEAGGGGVKTINQIRQEHGVHPVQVSQWKKEIQEQAKTLFEGKRGPQPVAAHSAPDRLYSEIGRLKMELDWLKKKLGIIELRAVIASCGARAIDLVRTGVHDLHRAHYRFDLSSIQYDLGRRLL